MAHRPEGRAFLGEVLKPHSLQVREEAPWRDSLSMGLGEVRGCDDPHSDDSSSLLHWVPRADPSNPPAAGAFISR